MKNIEMIQASESLAQAVRNLAGSPVVVTEDGVPIAALLPIDDADLESVALGTNSKFLAVIEQALAQCRQGLGLSAEAARRELGLLTH